MSNHAGSLSILLAGFLAIAVPAFAAQSDPECKFPPEQVASTIALSAPPSAEAGSRIDFTIAASPKLKKLCLDEARVADAIAPGADGKYSVALPADFAPGTHTLAAILDTGAARNVVSSKITIAAAKAAETPVIDKVVPHPFTKTHAAFTFSLVGRNFGSDPSAIRLKIGDLVDIPVCKGPCMTAPSADLRNPNEIEVGRLESLPNQPMGFQVTVGNQESNEVKSDLGYAGNTVILWALAGLAAVVLLVIAILSDLHKMGIAGEDYVFRALFIDAQTRTYSLSKFQFYAWTIAAIFGYGYFAISRNFVQGFFALPDVPANLPGIIGISAFSAIGSQVITNVNGPKGAGELKPHLSDLLTTGGAVAADRVQFFVWTIIGAFWFCVIAAKTDPRAIAGLPDVPQGLMYLMGISSLGYLGGKWARDGGPVVDDAVLQVRSEPGADAAAAAPAPVSPDSPAVLAGRQAIAAAEAALAKAQPDPAGNSASPAAGAYTSASQAIAVLKQALGTVQSDTLTAAITQAKTSATAANQAAVAAAQASTTAADRDAAVRAASLAQQAAKAAQDAIVAASTMLGGIATEAAAAAPAPTPSAGWRDTGVLELRGRNLSPDATFEMGDDKLGFDKLVPVTGPDGKDIQKPEVVLADDQSSDKKAFAKTLRLKIALTDDTKKWFVKGQEYRVTIVNPDSQKAVKLVTAS